MELFLHRRICLNGLYVGNFYIFSEYQFVAGYCTQMQLVQAVFRFAFVKHDNMVPEFAFACVVSTWIGSWALSGRS